MDKEELLKAIGLRIKNTRVSKAISQQELAAACNFEKSNMSRIESGGSNITIYTLQKIASALNVRLTDLVDVSSTLK